jgi:hypothetical protein
MRVFDNKSYGVFPERIKLRLDAVELPTHTPTVQI